MKKLTFVVLTILLFALVVPLAGATSKGRPLDIRSVTIEFDKTDATITVDFDFPAFTKMYLLLLGSKHIEPEIRSIFSNFDFEIVNLDQNSAEIRVKNISRFDKGYYLHDSREFGTTIGTVYIYTTDSPRPREYYNLNSTPPTFYRG